LNVLTVNDNSGLTTINSGTVQVGNGSTSGSLGGGNIVNNAALAFNLPDSRTIAGQISGSGSLTVQAGTVVLTANNSYSGSTTVSGTVQVGNNTSTGSLGTGPVTDNGAVIFKRTGVVTNAGAISGSGTLAVQGAVTVALAANNSYAGATTVDTGTLQVGIGGAAGTLGTAGTVTLTNGGTLAFNRSDSVTNAVTILGTNGILAQVGPGSLVITNDANDYGATVITGGSLQLGNGINASGKLGRSSVTVTSPGDLVVNRPDAYNFSNAVSGSGSVFYAGTTNHVTTLGVANTYSGGTTISNSYVELLPQATVPAVVGVQLVNQSGLGSGTVTFLGNSTLQLAASTQNDPDLGGSGNFSVPINVPAGQTVMIQTPGRFEFSSAVTGAGTINYGANYVRGNVSGNWSNFFGTLNVVSNSVNTNTAAHDFRVFNANGFPNARMNLQSSALFWRGAANAVVPIGEFSGDELAFFGGTGGAEGGNAVTWLIGGLNTDGTYGGTSGGTVAIGIQKVGSGRLTFTGVNSYIGNTTVSNGILALATNSVAANGDISSTPIITLAAPGSLSVTGRTDSTFSLGAAAVQTLRGNGSVFGDLAVNGVGTLSPGFSVGTMNVFGNVSFGGGTYQVEANLAGTPTSDRVVAQNVDVNTAVIIVTNLGPVALTNGTALQIFQASGTISGTPASVTGGVPPGPGAGWNTANLTINGTITAVFPPSPSLTNVVNTPGMLDFSWDSAYLGWRLYAQTNSLNVGINNNWTAIEGTEGTTTIQIPVDNTVGTVFYRLSYP
jgi:fibronectin-binding autotransporter adhesin